MPAFSQPNKSASEYRGLPLVGVLSFSVIRADVITSDAVVTRLHPLCVQDREHVVGMLCVSGKLNAVALLRQLLDFLCTSSLPAIPGVLLAGDRRINEIVFRFLRDNHCSQLARFVVGRAHNLVDRQQPLSRDRCPPRQRCGDRPQLTAEKRYTTAPLSPSNGTSVPPSRRKVHSIFICHASPKNCDRSRSQIASIGTVTAPSGPARRR